MVKMRILAHGLQMQACRDDGKASDDESRFESDCRQLQGATRVRARRSKRDPRRPFKICGRGKIMSDRCMEKRRPPPTSSSSSSWK
ncbi:hypothetical protein BHE74_00001406 [Ensete ventricosum]|uniref:Uncharacterized protein n=1 Tax=Ensete ventricosum TaxID=4639 RepID=A0A445M8E0_ENSVE|nr:hypothetical protein BHE74_00001406 [Ensete ventricosum]RZR70516.1 hypothetical protein BHM03_00000359 [Ensete ventricosum]